MKKWIAIPVIAVLVIGIIVTAYLLAQQTGKLGEARTEIAVLQGNISTLQGKLTGSEAEVSSLQGRLTGSEATVATLQTDLTSANSNIKNLQSDVSTQRTLNSTLSTELKKVKDPKHFVTLAELTDWVAKDDTNTKYATASVTQKAFILQVRALRDGYLLPAALYLEGGTVYVGNRAVIGDSVYAVLAGDDRITRMASAQPIPSHPLPLD